VTAKRSDANQPEIVAALRAAGRYVIDLHEVGKGVPDLLVICTDGRLVLLEVKTPGGKLTKDEAIFFAAVERYNAPVHVVRTAGYAITLTEAG